MGSTTNVAYFGPRSIRARGTFGDGLVNSATLAAARCRRPDRRITNRKALRYVARAHVVACLAARLQICKALATTPN